jgi:hypothetical protein
MAFCAIFISYIESSTTYKNCHSVHFNQNVQPKAKQTEAVHHLIWPFCNDSQQDGQQSAVTSSVATCFFVCIALLIIALNDFKEFTIYNYYYL